MPTRTANIDPDTQSLQVDALHVAPSHIDRAIARIRAYRQAQGWSINRLATEAGMTESVLRRLDEPDWNPEAKTLRKLECVVPADFRPAKLEREMAGEKETVVEKGGTKARRDERR